MASLVEMMEFAIMFRRFASLAKCAEAHDGEMNNAHIYERQARHKYGSVEVEAYLDAHAPSDPWIDGR